MGLIESTCNGPCTSPLHSLKRWGLEVGGALRLRLEAQFSGQLAAGSWQNTDILYTESLLNAASCLLPAVFPMPQSLCPMLITEK